MEHDFTPIIKGILINHFGSKSDLILEKSLLLQYINFKTKSASKDAKARGSFASLYAVYVVLEDYLEKGFDEKEGYADYEGAEFSKLFKRQRELPFGAKLQNHALNNRMNSEFQKYFPSTEFVPILRNLETNRYWINEHLLKIKVENKTYNIAQAIVEIINKYAQTKRDSFEQFLKACIELQTIGNKEPKYIEDFILKLIAPNVDARLFEIVSYSILKYYYYDQTIYWGYDINKLKKDNLALFKTGRTNANDGGIDFIMKPLGKIFQVTETLDVKKYFLDIDKIHKYPITFVVKSDKPEEDLLDGIRYNAEKVYSVNEVIDRYMQCIEEIINIHKLHEYFKIANSKGYLKDILDEIILQSKVEFNYTDDIEED